VPGSKVKVALARILKEEGFIRDLRSPKDVPQSQLRIVLKYDRDRQPVITGLQRISKPGPASLREAESDPWVLSGLGVAVVSTPQGIMTGQRARKMASAVRSSVTFGRVGWRKP